jgi:hypothetical protein
MCTPMNMYMRPGQGEGFQLGSGTCVTCYCMSAAAGRRFFTRCHLSVCNMHYPPLAGIDYVSKGGKKNDQELYRLVRISSNM